MTIRFALLTAAALTAVATPAAAVQNISKRATVAPDAAVDLSNVQGSVTVTAWDRNEVELTAVLESDKDQLEFEATEREVRIKVKRPDGKYHKDTDDAILTLRVPKGVRLGIETVSAEITVTGVQGEQSLGSVSGTIETQAFNQPVDARSVSGELQITGNGGKAEVSTANVSGSTVANGLRGAFEGNAVSGDITAHVAAADRLEIGTVSGEIEAHAELTATARVELESVSGSIVLSIKPPVHAEFDLESFSGDIENCFGKTPRDTSKYAPGSELVFTQGNGGARVDIQTLSGEINVCGR